MVLYTPSIGNCIRHIDLAPQHAIFNGFWLTLNATSSAYVLIFLIVYLVSLHFKLRSVDCSLEILAINMSSLTNRLFRARSGENNVAATTRVEEVEISDGNLKFVIKQAGNDSLPSYQEASGAPVEVYSPLGYAVGPVTVAFLNISKMIGTGVYSTR